MLRVSKEENSSPMRGEDQEGFQEEAAALDLGSEVEEGQGKAGSW